MVRGIGRMVAGIAAAAAMSMGPGLLASPAVEMNRIVDERVRRGAPRLIRGKAKLLRSRHHNAAHHRARAKRRAARKALG